MATLTKTYLLDTSTEALTTFSNTLGSSTSASFATITDADGIAPNGSLLITTSGANRNSNSSFQLSNVSYESLGIPVSSTISSIQVTYSYTAGTITSGGSVTAGAVDHITSGNVTTNLIAAQTAKTVSDAGVWTTITGSTVTLSTLPSSDTFTLKFNMNLTTPTGGSSTANIYYDWIRVTFVYQPTFYGTSTGTSSPTANVGVKYSVTGTSTGLSSPSANMVISNIERVDNVAATVQTDTSVYAPSIPKTLTVANQANATAPTLNHTLLNTQYIYAVTPQSSADKYTDILLGGWIVQDTWAIANPSIPTPSKAYRPIVPTINISALGSSDILLSGWIVQDVWADANCSIPTPGKFVSMISNRTESAATSYIPQLFGYVKPVWANATATFFVPAKSMTLTSTRAEATAVIYSDITIPKYLVVTNVASSNTYMSVPLTIIIIRGPPIEAAASFAAPNSYVFAYAYGLPIEDVSTGMWSPTPLYPQLVDSYNVANNDYIVSSVNAVDDIFEVKLSSVLTNITNRTAHRISYAAYAVNTRNSLLTVTLLDGSTPIASWIDTVVPDNNHIVEHYLTQEEMDSIISYSNLRLRFEADI